MLQPPCRVHCHLWWSWLPYYGYSTLTHLLIVSLSICQPDTLN